MHITSLQVGPIMTNCYLLCDEAAKVCALIDPGDDAPQVAEMVARSGCALRYILLTHGHFDHTSAVRPLLEQHPDVPVYIHEKDAADTERGELLFRKVGPENQRYYKEGDTLPLGGLTLRVLETPGHSEGSVCLLVEGQGVLFAGDTLFRCSLRPVRLPRRRLPEDADLPGPSGGAGGQPAGAARSRPGDHAGLRAPGQPLHAARGEAMKLQFRGHDDRYAIEQSLLAFFPEERPVYEAPAPGEDDCAFVSLTEGKRYATGVTTLHYHGKTARGVSRAVLTAPPTSTSGSVCVSAP